jgi:transposase
MENPTGESSGEVLRLDFDRRLMLQFTRIGGHLRRGIARLSGTRRRARPYHAGGRDTRRRAHRQERPACSRRLVATVCARAPGAHAILLLDQAGWHVSKRLSIPDNITLLPLPPKSPELNPVENIWQFMRDNWLSNRVFKSYDDILDHCCFAWSKLIDMPWKIMSIGTRDWSTGHDHQGLV